MNELEERLRTTLRVAVPQPDVPAGLVHQAIRTASRARRRRLATRGALGTAALVAGGAVLAPLWQRPSGDRLTVAPLSETATASPGTASPSAAADGCRLHRPESNAGTCERFVIMLRSKDGDLIRTMEMEDHDPGDSSVGAPPELVITYDDGSTEKVAGRSAGPGRWVFDVETSDGMLVATLRVAGRDDTAVQIRPEPTP